MSDLYIAHPYSGRVFHVFDADDCDRSLCGRYGMIVKHSDQCDEITETTKWVKGQDCKACFRKAGLLPTEAEGGS